MENFDQIGTYRIRIQEAWPSDLVCSNQSDVIIISVQASTRLFIFPNPNNGHFKISYYNNGGAGTQQIVTVYNLKGAKLYNARFTISGMYTLLNIKIVPAPCGFYSVVVADANGKRLAVGKIIVD